MMNEENVMENKGQSNVTNQPINIGIETKDRKQVCQVLSRLLADSYLLYLKTQNYHWNVTGKMFQSLHTLFEEQYKDLAEAVDEIAERIRALGEFAPGSFAAFSQVSSIKEETSIPTAEEMIQNLVIGNEAVITTAREVITLCDDVKDEVTVDLMVERMQVHEKNAWMLRSMITPNISAH
jgi:starvation-inducible DNA-binding protein